MHAYVSREEWVFRGLAIAMCLAMVGMAVMPVVVGDIGAVVWWALGGDKLPHPWDYATGAFATGAGGAAGAYAAMWIGARIGGTAGAIIGGPIGIIVGAGVGAA